MTDDLTPWKGAFPKAFRNLVIDKKHVSIFDQREADYFQRFGVDFSKGDLHRFIEKYLMEPESIFYPLRNGSTENDASKWTINVRRGDYYSNPSIRGLYSFDIVAYLKEVLAREKSLHSGANIKVVSDDIGWCKLKLEWLKNHGVVHFSEASGGPVADFSELSLSTNLVLSNSTFSYWAAYVSSYVHRDISCNVWAPAFHNRDARYTPAPQLDPSWNVIETLPGGWDA